MEYQYDNSSGLSLLIVRLAFYSHHHPQVRIRVQLNSILFAKTLVRKDVASSAAAQPSAAVQPGHNPDNPTEGSGATSDPLVTAEGQIAKKVEEEEFSSKAQIMTLMTTDVDRVSEFSWHIFSLVGEY